MAEKITKIQIGADVRDIGLGLEAAWELGSSVMEQIGQTAHGMTLDGGMLSVKTGEGLKVTGDTGVELDTAWLFGTMKVNPWLFVDRKLYIDLLAPEMGNFAGQGLTYEDNKFKVPLGSGLELDNGKICVNLGYGVEYSGDGSLNINLGSCHLDNDSPERAGFYIGSGGQLLPNLGSGNTIFDHANPFEGIHTGLKSHGEYGCIMIDYVSPLKFNYSGSLTLDTAALSGDEYFVSSLISKILASTYFVDNMKEKLGLS